MRWGRSTLPFRHRVRGVDAGVGDALVEDVPVEGGLELGAVVSLGDFGLERQALNDVVQELDGGVLVAGRSAVAAVGAVVD